MKAIRRISIGLVAFLSLMFLLILLGGSEDSSNQYSAMAFTGEYTEDLPEFPDVKGRGQFSDEVAQLAMGTAVKYRLLPSVILSQWAYESAWGESSSAKNDSNYFGITWFSGCPYPQGSARGVGGSEGGNYMKFPSQKASFSYYGYMVAVQSNFNQCVSNTSPGECLLILGRGGYAAAGITESSPYYTACMGIIENNSLTDYDEYAIERWADFAPTSDGTSSIEIVAVAQKEISGGLHVGGQRYWSWYGFSDRVEWCACFVSYCSEQAGLIAAGKAPKHASCLDGVNWFSERGKYEPAKSGYEPQPGDLIYFDWAGGGTGGHHVGIVESCDGTIVRTIEGNSGDQLSRQSYSVSDPAISGYGVTN